MASYVFQLFKKVFFSVDKKSESGEKSGGKRKYCEMGVGTGDDLETTPPPRKKLNLGTKPPEQIPPVSAPTMDEVRRKSCTNFGDLVKFEETFGLPPPTLISGEIGEGSVDKTTPTVATSTSTSTNTSDTPTTTPTTTADTKTTKVAPTDTKSSKTDSTEAKGDDPKAEAEKKEKEEEEFIKSHEVHVVANGRHGISTQPPPDFSSPSLQNYDLNNQIDFLRKNVINPIKCRELYKTGNISLPKGIYFHGGDINCQALLLVKALATELGKEFGDGAKPLRIFRRWKVDVFSKYSGDGGAEVFVDWLFSAATKFQPSIIFIENLDQFGSYCRHDICKWMDR